MWYLSWIIFHDSPCKRVANLTAFAVSTKILALKCRPSVLKYRNRFTHPTGLDNEQSLPAGADCCRAEDATALPVTVLEGNARPSKGCCFSSGTQHPAQGQGSTTCLKDVFSESMVLTPTFHKNNHLWEYAQLCVCLIF